MPFILCDFVPFIQMPDKDISNIQRTYIQHKATKSAGINTIKPPYLITRNLRPATMSLTDPATSTPTAVWVGIPYKPSPHECPSCALCTTGKDCPAAAHPFNTFHEKGLRCYECSACSHRGYEPPETGALVNAPKPYKKPPAGLYTNDASILALAEMQNSKATIYMAQHASEIPENGEIIAVSLRQQPDPAVIVEEARESVRRKLREVSLWFRLEFIPLVWSQHHTLLRIARIWKVIRIESIALIAIISIAVQFRGDVCPRPPRIRRSMYS
ncbi:hypothetical protein BJX63DRAFT_6007 [Aspergillus granulosus]|uniref:4Fe-4S ferredoxin-type domain-containing protein n=1 Tax=Aspergillus granulosus TaxID=176169 RepID=A0ABR4I7Z9_9EURO